MKERINSFCGYLICISAILMMLITVVDMVCFDKNFYEKEYIKYESADSLGISNEDLMKSTNALLDYIRGDRNDIVVEINLRGNLKETFNSRETMHMVDVKGLYDYLMMVRLGSLLILVAGFIYLIVKMKQEVLYFIATRFLKTAVCFLFVVACFGAWVYVDFNNFWTSFHLIFFRNDLWLLNPLTDFMINMFPEELFFDLVFRIVLCFLIPFVLSCTLCVIYLKRETLMLNQPKPNKENI